MRLNTGTEVFTADNEHVGNVERVVIDPETNEITHLVIQKGFLFTEDKVVPIEWIATAENGHVMLKPTEGEFDELPAFEETYYVATGIDPEVTPPADDTRLARPYYWYPPVGTAWWGAPGYGAYPRDYYVAATERNIPENTVALKAGTRVISADAEHVGDVAEFVVDEESERITHVVIAEGLFFKKKRLVPSYWIKMVGEDELWLTVDAAVVETLPDHEDR